MGEDLPEDATDTTGSGLAGDREGAAAWLETTGQAEAAPPPATSTASHRTDPRQK